MSEIKAVIISSHLKDGAGEDDIKIKLRVGLFKALLGMGSRKSFLRKTGSVWVPNINDHLGDRDFDSILKELRDEDIVIDLGDEIIRLSGYNS